jgi:heme exporter protein CcmD
MNSIDHFGFILAAYIAGVVVIGAMIILTVMDYASLKKRLAQLTARAGTRSDDV